MLLSDMLIRIFDLAMLILSDLKKKESSLIDKRISEHEGKSNKNKTGGKKLENY